MRILTLGAGALGGYVGGKLQKSGCEVDFMVRPRRAAQLAERGLVIREAGGSFTLPARTRPPGQASGHYDVVLLACKSYDLARAIDDIAPAVSTGTVVLPLLNGVAHIDVLRNRFGAERVIGGASYIYSSLSSEGEIERGVIPFDGTDVGELDGSASARCDALAASLNKAGIVAARSDNIRAFMWRKMFGFSATAVVTTLLGARAGEIAAVPPGSVYVKSVVDEIAAIAAKEGFPVAPEDRELISRLFSQPGSPYAPSIFRDMEAGRPTEADHTIGDLVRRGEAHRLAVPLCRAALCKLQIVERRRVASNA